MRIDIEQVIASLAVAAVVGTVATFFLFQGRISKLEVTVARLEKIYIIQPDPDPPPVPPRPQDAQLEGTLFDRAGNTISGISVGIRNGPQTITDNNGRFVLKGVSSGDQLLIAVPQSGGSEVTQNISLGSGKNTINIVYSPGKTQLALLSITAPVDSGQIDVIRDGDTYRALISGRCDGLVDVFSPKSFDIWVLVRSAQGGDGKLWIQQSPASCQSGTNTWRGGAFLGNTKRPPRDGEIWEIVVIAAPIDAGIERISNTPSLSRLPPHIRAYTKTNYAIFIYAASANSTGSHNRLSIKRIDAT